MAFNPNYHNRQSIRLNSYDYSKEGVYSFTICTYNRRCLLGEIRDGKMILNSLGHLIQNEWYELTNRFEHIKLDEFVIMPNHTHGIIIIKKIEPTTNISDKSSVTNVGNTKIKIPTLGDIIGSFKSLVYLKHLKESKSINPNLIVGTLWQRNYFERIILNNEDLDSIRHYIRNNPTRWLSDDL